MTNEAFNGFLDEGWMFPVRLLSPFSHNAIYYTTDLPFKSLYTLSLVKGWRYDSENENGCPEE